MLKALRLTLIVSATSFCFAAPAMGVTKKPHAESKQKVTTVTTTAANRAESDLQVRLIKNLLAEEEINSDAYLAQVEKIRKKLGQ